MDRLSARPLALPIEPLWRNARNVQVSLAFLVTTLVVVATPGTGVVYTLSAGLTRGRRASIVAAAGCTLGIVPHMAATITGLAALLHTSALAFQTLKYLGVAYLLYMAWATMRDRDAVVVGQAAPPPTAAKTIANAVLVNILNPKLTIFFVAFLPQFVRTGEPNALLHMIGLSGVFMLVTFVVFAGYGIFAASVRHYVVSRPAVLRWLRRVFAASFVALAARLAVADR
jgi:threonine/homoserine/homoserine lactone efflux protein